MNNGAIRITGAALAATMALGSLAGCAQASAPEPESASVDDSFATPPVDFDDRKEVAAEEERLRQEHIAAWRARFPLDDYSNTLLIGDSLMQNAAASLRAAMPGVAINADAGRTLETGGLVFDNESPDAGVLDLARKDDGSYARYVIGTGNNDGNGMSIDAAQEIVDCLGPDKEIYFITMCSLKSPDATDTTNQSIDAMVGAHANVHKIDWRGLISGHEYDYLRDGIHVHTDREPDYAACIKDGLDVVY